MSYQDSNKKTNDGDKETALNEAGHTLKQFTKTDHAFDRKYPQPLYPRHAPFPVKKSSD